PNGSGVIAVLATVAAAVQYADEAQRRDLLADPFVRSAMDRAMELAAGLEQQGRWLDAYVKYGALLKAIDPDNQLYKERTQDWLEKAEIAATFEDSPCQTSKQRFEGVSRRIYTRAVRVLGTRYVNSVDYTQMASDGLRRARQLGEVLARLDTSKVSYLGPVDPNKLRAWHAGLSSLQAQVADSAVGLDERSFLRLFEDLLRLNLSTVNIPEEVLIWHFAQASLEALDPHTVIVWPREKSEFDSMLTNEFSGIGVEISKQDGVLTIVSLLLDTPAYKAGLDAGDVIEAVDGIATKDITVDCAKEKIRGPRGTKVTLTIRRPGQEGTREVTIVRDRILVPSIYGWQRTEDGKWRYIIDPNNKIAYIRLNSFAKDTANQLEAILKDLEKDGLSGLILDLRWNQGGLLDVALKIVDMFVKDGVMLRVRPGLYGGLSEAAHATLEGTHPDYPLVILVNSVSASASEIVSGALGDPLYKRAVIVGERTHGKGSVQSIEDRGLDGAELKYTTAYYYLPSDRRVNSREAMEKLGRKDWGIGPDVEVIMRPDEVRRMLAGQRANDILVQPDRPATKEQPQRKTAQELMAADPQLAIGMLVLKAKMVEAGLPVG
ncbi:MAG: S41 family peptidase, partial [Sedimentisphaerales bacterium]|nr:S41 family peptidase [Sedimentisphaerales bacterium]